MEYRIRKVKCPHCNKVAEKTKTPAHKVFEGSPFRVCPHCRATYFDSEYKEPGLLHFADKGGDFNFIGILSALTFTPLSIFLLYNFSLNTDTDLLFAGIFIGIFAIIGDFGLIRAIWNRIHAEAYHQKQIEFIEGRTMTRPDKLIHSMERLSNISYLNALKAYGVDVPDYFFQRLRGSVDSNNAPKEPTTTIPPQESNAASSSIQSRHIFCRKCGEKLPNDSLFCTKCGEKVIR